MVQRQIVGSMLSRRTKIREGTTLAPPSRSYVDCGSLPSLLRSLNVCSILFKLPVMTVMQMTSMVIELMHQKMFMLSRKASPGI